MAISFPRMSATFRNIPPFVSRKFLHSSHCRDFYALSVPHCSCNVHFARFINAIIQTVELINAIDTAIDRVQSNYKKALHPRWTFTKFKFRTYKCFTNYYECSAPCPFNLSLPSLSRKLSKTRREFPRYPR